MGVNYKLGVIDNEEIKLYYLKDRYTENGLDRVPICEIEIKNKKQDDGVVRIEFAIAKFVLIIVGLIPLIFAAILYFEKGPVPFYYALVLYPILYLVLVFVLSDQSNKFQGELRKMESEAY